MNRYALMLALWVPIALGSEPEADDQKPIKPPAPPPGEFDDPPERKVIIKSPHEKIKTADKERKKEEPKPEAEKAPEEKDVQTRRKEFIQDMINVAVFSSLEIRGEGLNPKLVVGAKWYALDFEKKSSVVGIVYAYVFPDDDGSSFKHWIKIYEPMDGKQIGEFWPTTGLKIY